MIGKTISHYRILEKLGEGGMGVVYKAEDTKLKRTVALKFLTPQALGSEDQRTRFVREAQAAAALDHPNICTVYEIGEADDQTFIAMAYIDGQSLNEKIESGPLKLDEALDITIQVAEGLQQAHEKGIVHRDVKSANIMVNKKCQAKTMDFGLAKLASSTLVTKEGTTMGTVAYMSPEQARGEDVDHRTDIWAFGVVLYEMIAGKLPFRGEYEPAVVYSILNEDPVPITGLRMGVPMELDRIVNKTLAKNPDERYQNLGDTLVDLRSVRKQLESLGMKAGLKGRFDRKMLVVLPIENLGPSDEEYFADGLTEEITARLSYIDQLGVIARTSAIQYKNTDKTINQIGEELGVEYILEGTVRWQRSTAGPSQIRITPQLIKVSDATHLWADVYNEKIEDIFEIQTDIAEKVAKALDIKLLEPVRKSLQSKPTDNLEAYDYYLRGGEHQRIGFSSLDDREYKHAVQMYEKAIELDPQFTMAHVTLSDILSWMYNVRFDRTEQCLSRSRKAAEKALETHPEMPEALEVLAHYYWRGFLNFDRAYEILELIRKKRPNYSPYLMATILSSQGKMNRAVEAYEEAFELNPRDSKLAAIIGSDNMVMRRYSEAEQWFNQALLIEPEMIYALANKAWIPCHWKGNIEESIALLEMLPRHPFVNYLLFQAYLFERGYERAKELIASLSYDTFEYPWYYFQKDNVSATIYYLQNNPTQMCKHAEAACYLLERTIREQPNEPSRHSALGMAYAYLNQKDKAIREGKQALELHPISKDTNGVNYIFYLAEIYSIIGEQDKAIDKLEYLLSVPSYDVSVPLLRLDPMWDPLRDHPRFKKLLEKEGPVSF